MISRLFLGCFSVVSRLFLGCPSVVPLLSGLPSCCPAVRRAHGPLGKGAPLRPGALADPLMILDADVVTSTSGTRRVRAQALPGTATLTLSTLAHIVFVFVVVLVFVFVFVWELIN